VLGQLREGDRSLAIKDDRKVGLGGYFRATKLMRIPRGVIRTLKRARVRYRGALLASYLIVSTTGSSEGGSVRKTFKTVSSVEDRDYIPVCGKKPNIGSNISLF